MRPIKLLIGAGVAIAFAASCSSAPTNTPESKAAPAQNDAFTTIWTRPAEESRPHQAIGRDELRITRLAVSHDQFGVDLKHMSDAPASRTAGVQDTPTASLIVDGCPGPTFSLGRATSFAFDRERILIPRARLPKGDIEVTVRAFQQQDSIFIRHDDQGIQPITLEEHKLYRELPGDDAKGTPPVSWMESAGGCPQ